MYHDADTSPLSTLAILFWQFGRRYPLFYPPSGGGRKKKGAVKKRIAIQRIFTHPIIEAINGWIKEELYLDFGLAEAENLPDLLNQYVYFFNNYRPAAALGYKSPVQYKTELGFV